MPRTDPLRLLAVAAPGLVRLSRGPCQFDLRPDEMRALARRGEALAGWAEALDQATGDPAQSGRDTVAFLRAAGWRWYALKHSPGQGFWGRYCAPGQGRPGRFVKSLTADPHTAAADAYRIETAA